MTTSAALRRPVTEGAVLRVLDAAAELLAWGDDGPALGCYEARPPQNEAWTLVMARKPRDYDAELQALMERTKKLKGQKTTRLGELVQVTGADTLPIEALAGVLLAAVEQAKKQPEAVARWTERGEALFRTSKRDGGKAGSGGDAAGATPAGPGTPAAGGGA